MSKRTVEELEAERDRLVRSLSDEALVDLKVAVHTEINRRIQVRLEDHNIQVRLEDHNGGS